jgi:hypothetical protein
VLLRPQLGDFSHVERPAEPPWQRHRPHKADDPLPLAGRLVKVEHEAEVKGGVVPAPLLEQRLRDVGAGQRDREVSLGALPDEADQHARTRGAAEHLSNFAGAFMKETVRASVVLNKNQDISERDLDQVQIRLTAAQNETIWQATKSMPVLADMAVKFITTDRSTGFVVSDHPVVAYNQFAEHHPVLRYYPTRSALAAKGLQLFMPLSPSMMIAIFDPSTYEYGGKKTVCRAGAADVAFLNRMQAVSAFSCVYFHEARVDEPALSDLTQWRVRHPSVYSKRVQTSPFIRRPDGRISQFVVTYQTEMALGAKLSFVRTTDGHQYTSHDGPCVPVRSPTLLSEAERFGEVLERIVAERRAGIAAGVS